MSDEDLLRIAEAGGRHAGFVKLRHGKSATALLREAAKLRTRAAEHREKIDQRIGYNAVSDDPAIQKRAEAARTRHLEREIENFIQQADPCEQLAERKTRSPN